MSRSTATSTARLLTVAQAAEHLGTTTSKVYELVERHAIPSVRIGRAIRIAQDDLDRLLGRAGEAEATVRQADHQRMSRVDTGGELEDRSRRDDSLGRRSGTEARRPSSATVSMPERRQSAKEPSERRQPDSRETARSDTDLHPGATRRRVDAEPAREARS